MEYEGTKISSKCDANKNEAKTKELNDCSVQDQAELSQSEITCLMIRNISCIFTQMCKDFFFFCEIEISIAQKGPIPQPALSGRFA